MAQQREQVRLAAKATRGLPYGYVVSGKVRISERSEGSSVIGTDLRVRNDDIELGEQVGF